MPGPLFSRRLTLFNIAVLKEGKPQQSRNDLIQPKPGLLMIKSSPDALIWLIWLRANPVAASLTRPQMGQSSIPETWLLLYVGELLLEREWLEGCLTSYQPSLQLWTRGWLLTDRPTPVTLLRRVLYLPNNLYFCFRFYKLYQILIIADLKHGILRNYEPLNTHWLDSRATGQEHCWGSVMLMFQCFDLSMFRVELLKPDIDFSTGQHNPMYICTITNTSKWLPSAKYCF